MKIVATGGIYVQTSPAADKITIDSKISDKPGLFSNGSIFVQSLLPKDHTVSIKKSGYYDYFKQAKKDGRMILLDNGALKRLILLARTSRLTAWMFIGKNPWQGF